MRTQLGAIGAALVLLALMLACGGGPADKYTRDCTARNGHVVVTHRRGSTVRICAPN